MGGRVVDYESGSVNIMEFGGETNRTGEAHLSRESFHAPLPDPSEIRHIYP